MADAPDTEKRMDVAKRGLTTSSLQLSEAWRKLQHRSPQSSRREQRSPGAENVRAPQGAPERLEKMLFALWAWLRGAR